MENQIYKVITHIIELDNAENSVNVKVFDNKDLAYKYFNELKEEIKEQNEELDMDYYCIDEDEFSYERYLDGRACESLISVWIEEDTIIKELENNKENDNEYEYSN